MSQLVIHLPLPDAAGTGLFSYVLSHNGQDVARHGATEAALLPFSGVQDVVALVPVQALSWHVVDLPKGASASPARLRSVLEGLLEEHLLDDADTLHMAVAPGVTAPCSTWVAVCDAGWLRAALQALEQAGCAVGRIVPEFYPLAQPSPANPPGDGRSDALADMPTAAPATAVASANVHLYAIGGDAQPAWWVRTGSDLCHGSHAPGVLAWPLPSPTSTSVNPGTLPLPVLDALALQAAQADPAVAKAAEHWLRQPVQIVPAAQRWLQAAQSPWNLAQFAFANSGRDRLRKRGGQLWHRFAHAPQWRAARWGLVGLLAVQLAGLNVWAWRTRASMEQQKRDIANILSTTFPDGQPVIDAPVQMQRQVALLQQGSGMLEAADLEALLASAAQHLPTARLQALEWEASQLRLKGLAMTPGQQAAWQADLASRQLQLRQDGSDWLVGPAR